MLKIVQPAQKSVPLLRSALDRLVKEPKRIGRMAKLPLVLVKAAGRRASGRGKQRVL